MSFDIFYQTFRYLGESSTRTNPFTGETQTSLMSEPLSDKDSESVLNVLRHNGAVSPSESKCFNLNLPNGNTAEVFFGSEDQSSLMVSLRGMSDELVQFLFDLLAAAPWAMIPAMEDTAIITTSKDCIVGLEKFPAASFPEVVVCQSPGELGNLLKNGASDWKKYRDKVVGEN